MRYSNDRTIKGGNSKATNVAAQRLRRSYQSGLIDTKVVIIGENLRLDHIAYQYLGDPSMWWAIAALSNIGWGLQLPAGTRLIVPINVKQIEELF